LASAQLELNTKATKPKYLHPDNKEYLNEMYDVKEALGHGSMAVVYRAFRRSNSEQVALKVVRTSDEEVIAIAKSEFELLQRLEHPSIIRVLEFFSSANRAVIAMPFFDGESLFSTVRSLPLKRFPEKQAHSLFQELLSALDYLHGCRIVHRDVKPENVLIRRDLTDISLPLLKLIDFNIARYLPEGGALSPHCTPQYAAPEIRMGGSPSEASDIWGAGLCLCMLLSGHCPRIEVGAAGPLLDGKENLNVSAPCRLLIQKCLAIELSMRPAAMMLLQYTWVKYGPPAGEKDFAVEDDGLGCSVCQDSICSTTMSGTLCQESGTNTPSPCSTSMSWERDAPSGCSPRERGGASPKLVSSSKARSKSC
jgi:serine/threonine protein kinase